MVLELSDNVGGLLGTVEHLPVLVHELTVLLLRHEAGWLAAVHPVKHLRKLPQVGLL